MKKMLGFIFIFLMGCYSPLSLAITHLVAAENFYGSVAKEIGGSFVTVNSIISSPNQDPHLFTLTPSTVKNMDDADIIVYNGIDYDAWIQPILSASKKTDRTMINVAELIGMKPGSNPHIWYQPNTILVYAKKLTSALSAHDPSHQAYFKSQLKRFIARYQPLLVKIKRMRLEVDKTPVIAVEPLFNYMAADLGLEMHGFEFQINIMNDVAPTISEIKQFEDDLNHHTVKLLIYNRQVENKTTKRMMEIANKNGIPCLGVTETLPPSLDFVQWMTMQLNELEILLKQPRGR